MKETCTFNPTNHHCWESVFTMTMVKRRSNSTEARSLGPSENNNIKVTDEDVLTKVLVDIWVVAHMQNSSCHSLKSTVKLIGRVKYEPPKISMSRSSGNLTLSWENNKATLTLEDLQQPYVYELQVRHRSKLATDPLWSDWTPILDVPTAWSIDKTGPHNYFKSFKKSCLEWYKLTDGKTRPDKVNKTPIDKPLNEKLQAIMQEMDDFVPYYYLVHNLTKKRWQTTEMRLMYKKEREPRTAPGNVKIDSITSTTATLHWEHIPVSDQRGFLTHYTVCNKMTNQNDRGNTTNECHNISASETKYVIQNLTPRSTYEIRLYGGTSIGSGPAASIGAVTQVQFPDSTVFLARIQDMYEIKEEVHELQLHNKRSKEPKSEESSLLNVCRTYECDNTDDKSLGDQRSPDYNGQVLQLEALDPSTGETDCEVAMLMYRNGLVFDMNAESTEDVGSPL
ncbi:hypothetical protein DPEC_G00271240 [Dallia pectoralis]|uniref:Uncharacterized protein n=1 Tax=Dallia pectoralis TaxID=75939 RepID=A0ACC2FPI0_DALPE|nr:hypothetical protein DPEC_G00271240 [Dallia pectoralis]